MLLVLDDKLEALLYILLFKNCSGKQTKLGLDVVNLLAQLHSLLIGLCHLFGWNYLKNHDEGDGLNPILYAYQIVAEIVYCELLQSPPVLLLMVRLNIDGNLVNELLIILLKLMEFRFDILSIGHLKFLLCHVSQLLHWQSVLWNIHLVTVIIDQQLKLHPFQIIVLE